MYLLGPDVKSDPKSPSLLSASPRLFRKGSKTSRVSFGSVRVEGDEKVDAGKLNITLIYIIAVFSPISALLPTSSFFKTYFNVWKIDQLMIVEKSEWLFTLCLYQSVIAFEMRQMWMPWRVELRFVRVLD